MAATSTNWGLGAHNKMTADISTPAPVTVASPSTDSPIKAKSFNAIEGSAKETQVPSSIAATTAVNIVNGEKNATAAAVAATAAAAAAAASKLTVNSNGVASGQTAVDGAKDGSKEENVVEECIEAGGTSSDSDGEEDEEEQEGGASAPDLKKVGGEVGGAKVAQANGHHGPVQSTQSAGTNADNGHDVVAATAATAGSITPKQEVDEHAARASDAATAALAAALASAARQPPAPRPARPAPAVASLSLKPAAAAVTSLCLKVDVEEREAAAAAASAVAAAMEAVSASATANSRGGNGQTVKDPIVMRFQVPERLDLPHTVDSPHVQRALAAARFVSPPGEGAGEESRGVDGMDIDGDDDEEQAGEDIVALPEALALPTVPMPCMVGYFKVDETTGIHRCAGTWAMTKADLDAAAKIETRASPFEFKTIADGGSGERGAASLFPHCGDYKGHFLVRQPPKPVIKVDENDLHLSFARNSAGGWNVDGNGRNIYGMFTITGLLGTNRKLEVYRAYHKITPARGHRRANSNSHPSGGAGGHRTPATPVGRGPNGNSRGKQARTVTPSPYVPPAELQPTPTAPAGFGIANGGLSAMDLESPVPTSRRVSRTPSYLIKDIGNDRTAHLSQGLRRCVALIRGLMTVRGKSEWFLEPVDHEGLLLVDYPNIVKRPMDLGTVRKKLEGGKYQNTQRFTDDVRLVFNNARLYNSDPMSLVHTAARELLGMFDSKLATLGPNLDEPPLKRKKSNVGGGGAGGGGGGGGGSTSSGSYNNNVDTDTEPEAPPPIRKRKSTGGGKSSTEGGGGSGSKKQRATPAASSPRLPPAPKTLAPATVPPPPVASPAAEDFPDDGDADYPPSMLEMQRKIAEMEAQILRMQNLAAAQQPPPVEPQKPPATTAAPKRKSKAKTGGPKAGGSAKKSPKSAGGKKGGAKNNPEKIAADKAAKAARAKAAAEKAEREAEAAAAAAKPLTFDEKKALSVAINKLGQDNLTRVVEIIQARMPLGSSDEEIELDIDSMDNLTLRDLQAFIMDVSARGGIRRDGDSDSDGEGW